MEDARGRGPQQYGEFWPTLCPEYFFPSRHPAYQQPPWETEGYEAAFEAYLAESDFAAELNQAWDTAASSENSL